MARLVSEDAECVSSLELSPSDVKSAQPACDDQNWQMIELRLSSGSRQMIELSPICRDPQDELAALARSLADFAGGKQAGVTFEPAEPSFELSFERAGARGIKVQAWIDSGNQETGFYRWDAAGIRFFTTDEKLAEFIAALRRDFLESRAGGV